MSTRYQHSTRSSAHRHSTSALTTTTQPAKHASRYLHTSLATGECDVQKKASSEQRRTARRQYENRAGRPSTAAPPVSKGRELLSATRKLLQQSRHRERQELYADIRQAVSPEASQRRRSKRLAELQTDTPATHEHLNQVCSSCYVAHRQQHYQGDGVQKFNQCLQCNGRVPPQLQWQPYVVNTLQLDGNTKLMNARSSHTIDPVTDTPILQPPFISNELHTRISVPAEVEYSIQQQLQRDVKIAKKHPPADCHNNSQSLRLQDYTAEAYAAPIRPESRRKRSKTNSQQQQSRSALVDAERQAYSELDLRRQLPDHQTAPHLQSYADIKQRIEREGILSLYESIRIPGAHLGDHGSAFFPSYAIGSTYRTDDNTTHGVATSGEIVRFDEPVDVLSLPVLKGTSVLDDFDDRGNPRHKRVSRLKRTRR